MKRSCIVVFIAVVVGVFGGCSQKKYFEPKDVNLQAEFSHTLSASIIHTSRAGALLKNYEVLDTSGKTHIEIAKGQRFLGKEGAYYLVQNGCDALLLIDSVTKTQSELAFNKCVVSATIAPQTHLSQSNMFIALVSADNSVIVYDVAHKRERFSQKLANITAINTLAAAPVFVDNKIIFPTLDGKIVIFDRASNTLMRDILIQSDKFFNNIIYLVVKNDLIIAATPKRISTIVGNSKTFNYDGDFRDLLLYKNKIYVLSNDGTILELDNTLKLLRKAHFEYARLHGIVIQNNTLYTLESHKYLIELSLENFLPVIYKVALPSKKSIFYTHDSLFYDKFYKRF
ncbi:plasminogen-binding protein [uncultured Helicobacter sp.]|uniref:plasminogen-binding protein n=1 Tax=uncultured Helicobacter sp. TaxID=175537 RepID=UPI00374E23F6